jgi:hypothetical protein
MFHPKPRSSRSLPLLLPGGAARASPRQVVSEGFAIAAASSAGVPVGGPLRTTVEAPRRVPLRGDHPVFRPALRGSKGRAAQVAGSPSKRRAATAELVIGFEANTTKRAKADKLGTWDLLASKAGHAPGAFNTEVVRDVMAVLKKSQYRSAGSYVHAAKARFVDEGNSVSQTLGQYVRKSCRSALRGIGDPKKGPDFPMASAARPSQGATPPKKACLRRGAGLPASSG